jgi:hypothetical protein
VVSVPCHLHHTVGGIPSESGRSAIGEAKQADAGVSEEAIKEASNEASREASKAASGEASEQWSSTV